MKKWAPYSSLIEQSTVLNKMLYDKNKKTKPLLSEDQKEKINYYLQSYKKGQITKIKFYYDGYIHEIKSIIKRIDVENQQLILDAGKLPFNEILDIE